MKTEKLNRLLNQWYIVTDKHFLTSFLQKNIEFLCLVSEVEKEIFGATSFSVQRKEAIHFRSRNKFINPFTAISSINSVRLKYVYLLALGEMQTKGKVTIYIPAQWSQIIFSALVIDCNLHLFLFCFFAAFFTLGFRAFHVCCCIPFFLFSNDRFELGF